MATLHPIGRATADAELKADVINQLEKALAVARDGQIQGCVLIFDHVARGWQWEASGVKVFSELLGRLEVVKYELITKYVMSSVK